MINAINAKLVIGPFLGVSHRFYHVWQRNLDTFLRLWTTELWPPFVEPALYLIALGFGLGNFVPSIEGMSYLQFIAPGIVATSAMWSASFECLYGSFVRMEYQKTYDAMIATPVSVEDVITGEIVWGVTRATMSAAAVFLVVAAMGLVSLPTGLGMVPVAALAGFTFAALAFAFTAISPSMYFFNYYVTLALTPMFLFSGVFYPITTLPEWAQKLSWFLPLTHVVQPSRVLATGQWDPVLLLDLLWLAVVGMLGFYASLILMKRRLIK